MLKPLHALLFAGSNDGSSSGGGRNDGGSSDGDGNNGGSSSGANVANWQVP